jgi:hypothetical protein
MRSSSRGGFSVALLGPRTRRRSAATRSGRSPDGRGTVAQGKIAGVPAKLLIGDPTLIVVQAAYADELERRLGWR